MTAPGAPSRRAVQLATRLLPAGAVRERYRRELMAELHELPRSARLRHVAGVLSRAWALRQALTQETTMPLSDPGPAAPLHCRLHLFHRYRLAFTDDGHRYRRCRDCGQDDPRPTTGPFDVIGLGMGGPR